jgi:hypothetical protein
MQRVHFTAGFPKGDKFIFAKRVCGEKCFCPAPLHRIIPYTDDGDKNVFWCFCGARNTPTFVIRANAKPGVKHHAGFAEFGRARA